MTKRRNQLQVNIAILSLMAGSALVGWGASAAPVQEMPAAVPMTPKAVSSAPVAASYGGMEPWKGSLSPGGFDFGALAGVGIIDSTAGFAFVGTAAVKLMERGFAADLSNTPLIEVQAGPLFVSGGTSFMMNAHLRWDFNKDEQWTFYGLGGVGTQVTSRSLGDRFIVYPRFGVGTLWSIQPAIRLRAEISHELIALGVNLPF